MSFMSNHEIHVKSRQIMLFVSKYVIYVKSCDIMSNHDINVKSFHSCQIKPFMSNHVIQIKSCPSCQIMSLMSFVIELFRKFSKTGGGGEVKYVFVSLRRQLRCQAEGKKPASHFKCFLYRCEGLVFLQLRRAVTTVVAVLPDAPVLPAHSHHRAQQLSLLQQI
jgi:hypothetical protein